MSAPCPPLPFPLRAGRVHEALGPAAAGFALIIAALTRQRDAGAPGQTGGQTAGQIGEQIAAQSALQADPRAPLLWIRPGWRRESLLPDGLAAFLPPERLLIAQSPAEADSLAVAEEALKDGATPLVVIEITAPLSLREGRRLQLAAQAGGGIGLCLTPEGMGSPAAETRWHCRPLFATSAADFCPAGAVQAKTLAGTSLAPSRAAGNGASTLMEWKIIKNKSGTMGAWNVRWNAQTHRLDVVSPAGF